MTTAAAAREDDACRAVSEDGYTCERMCGHSGPHAADFERVGDHKEPNKVWE